MVSCGYSHEDPSKFTDRIYKMIALGIGVECDDEETLPVATEPASDVSGEDVVDLTTEDDMEKVD
jgi:hypothetical protein